MEAKPNGLGKLINEARKGKGLSLTTLAAVGIFSLKGLIVRDKYCVVLIDVRKKKLTIFTKSSIVYV